MQQVVKIHLIVIKKYIGDNVYFILDLQIRLLEHCFLLFTEWKSAWLSTLTNIWCLVFLYIMVRWGCYNFEIAPLSTAVLFSLDITFCTNRYFLGYRLLNSVYNWVNVLLSKGTAVDNWTIFMLYHSHLHDCIERYGGCSEQSKWSVFFKATSSVIGFSIFWKTGYLMNIAVIFIKLLPESLGVKRGSLLGNKMNDIRMKTKLFFKYSCKCRLQISSHFVSA